MITMSKHIDVRHHKIREYIISGDHLSVEGSQKGYCDSYDNKAGFHGKGKFKQALLAFIATDGYIKIRCREKGGEGVKTNKGIYLK